MQTKAESHFRSTAMIFRLVGLIMETLIRLPLGDSDSVMKTYSAYRDESSLAGSRASSENFLSGESGEWLPALNFGVLLCPGL